MPKPLYKYSMWLCPQCGKELSVSSVKYHKIDNGVFKSDKVIIETTYECKVCGWSYWESEEV